MTRITLYIIETILGSGLFMLLYLVMISKKASYLFCRRYLVLCLILSIIIPLFNVPVRIMNDDSPIFQETRIETNSLDKQETTLEGKVQDTVATQTPQSSVHTMNWETVLGCIYILGVLLFAGSIIGSLIKIWKLKRDSCIILDDKYEIAENERIVSPFSFRKTIYIGKGYEDKERCQILSHEKSHISNRHTREKILMSLIRSLVWFNPFAWMAERRLEEVQEWQADKDALSKGYDLEEYQRNIIKMLFGLNPSTASGFNSSFTQNRLLHMKAQESHDSKKSVWIASVLMFIVCFGIFACKPEVRHGNDGPAQFVESHNHIFIYADRAPEGFDKSSSLRQEGIDVYSYPSKSNKNSCIIAINGYEFVRSSESEKLDWVNEDTWIYIGDRKASYKEFRSLRKNRYIGIVFCKAEKQGNPSIVYVVKNKSNASEARGFDTVIDYPGAGLPDCELIAGIHASKRHFSVQTEAHNVAEPAARFAVDGELTDLRNFMKSYMNSLGFSIITRNEKAENKYGEGIYSVVEFISDQHVIQLSLEEENNEIATYINNKKLSIDDLLQLIEKYKENCTSNVPQVYIVILDRTGLKREYSDRYIENLKSSCLPGNDSIVCVVHHT